MENLISPAKDHLDRPYLDRPGKAATVLAWVSGLLAIPGGFFGVVGVFLIIPPILWVLGTILLVGYVKEARGAARSRNFWAWSVTYNSVLLTATLILWLANLGELEVEEHLLFLTAASWQATAIYLSKLAWNNPNHGRRESPDSSPQQRELHSNRKPLLRPDRKHTAKSRAGSLRNPQTS